MRATSNEISLIELCYRLDLEMNEWLDALSRSVHQQREDVIAVSAHIVRIDDDGVSLIKWRDHGVLEGMRELALAQNAALTPEQGRFIYLNGSRVEALSERVAEEPRLRERIENFFVPHGVHDQIGIKGANPDGTCITLTGHASKTAELSKSFRDRFERIAIHLAAGLRLRQELGSSDPLADCDAIIDPRSERIEHAGDAVKEHLEPLREAAARINLARGELRRENPDKAIALWQGLVTGRWSLVDYFDTDGRHFLVARRNDPEVEGSRALTYREQQVVWYAAHHDTNKLIGYELGLGVSTVATHLRRAMRKLGVDSRAELIRLVHSLDTDGAESPRQADGGP